MQPWLSRYDFDSLIGEIPASFDTDRLAPTLREIVDGWLSQTIGAEAVSAYRALLLAHESLFGDDPVTDPESPVSEAERRAGRLIREFLTYAVWSAWVLKYGMSYTATGPVVKLNPDSDPISDRQRSDLHRYYRGLAEAKAAQLSGIARDPLACGPTAGYPQGPRLRAVRPVSPSRLGN